MANPDKTYQKVEARKALARQILNEYGYRQVTGDPPLLAMERVIEELGLVAMPGGAYTCPECGEEL